MRAAMWMRLKNTALQGWGRIQKAAGCGAVGWKRPHSQVRDRSRLREPGTGRDAERLTVGKGFFPRWRKVVGLARREGRAPLRIYQILANIHANMSALCTCKYTTPIIHQVCVTNTFIICNT